MIRQGRRSFSNALNTGLASHKRSRELESISNAFGGDFLLPSLPLSPSLKERYDSITNYLKSLPADNEPQPQNLKTLLVDEQLSYMQKVYVEYLIMSLLQKLSLATEGRDALVSQLLPLLDELYTIEEQLAVSERSIYDPEFRSGIFLPLREWTVEFWKYVFIYACEEGTPFLPWHSLNSLMTMVVRYSTPVKVFGIWHALFAIKNAKSIPSARFLYFEQSWYLHLLQKVSTNVDFDLTLSPFTQVSDTSIEDCYVDRRLNHLLKSYALPSPRTSGIAPLSLFGDKCNSMLFLSEDFVFESYKRLLHVNNFDSRNFLGTLNECFRKKLLITIAKDEASGTYVTTNTILQRITLYLVEYSTRESGCPIFWLTTPSFAIFLQQAMTENFANGTLFLQLSHRSKFMCISCMLKSRARSSALISVTYDFLMKDSAEIAPSSTDAVARLPLRPTLLLQSFSFIERLEFLDIMMTSRRAMEYDTIHVDLFGVLFNSLLHDISHVTKPTASTLEHPQYIFLGDPSAPSHAVEMRRKLEHVLWKKLNFVHDEQLRNYVFLVLMRKMPLYALDTKFSTLPVLPNTTKLLFPIENDYKHGGYKTLELPNDSLFMPLDFRINGFYVLHYCIQNRVMNFEKFLKCKKFMNAVPEVSLLITWIMIMLFDKIIGSGKNEMVFISERIQQNILPKLSYSFPSFKQISSRPLTTRHAITSLYIEDLFQRVKPVHDFASIACIFQTHYTPLYDYMKIASQYFFSFLDQELVTLNPGLHASMTSLEAVGPMNFSVAPVDLNLAVEAETILKNPIFRLYPAIKDHFKFLHKSYPIYSVFFHFAYHARQNAGGPQSPTGERGLSKATAIANEHRPMTPSRSLFFRSLLLQPFYLETFLTHFIYWNDWRLVLDIYCRLVCIPGVKALWSVPKKPSNAPLEMPINSFLFKLKTLIERNHIEVTRLDLCLPDFIRLNALQKYMTSIALDLRPNVYSDDDSLLLVSSEAKGYLLNIASLAYNFDTEDQALTNDYVNDLTVFYSKLPSTITSVGQLRHLFQVSQKQSVTDRSHHDVIEAMRNYLPRPLQILLHDILVLPRAIDSLRTEYLQGRSSYAGRFS